MTKLTKNIPITQNDKNKKPSGNRSEASKDYKDPVGSKDKMTPPKNSGYDEKQPK